MSPAAGAVFRVQAMAQRMARVGWHQDITPAADEPVRAALSWQCSLNGDVNIPGCHICSIEGGPHSRLNMGTAGNKRLPACQIHSSTSGHRASLQKFGCKPTVRQRQATTHQPPQLVS